MNHVNVELAAEAVKAPDMFEATGFSNLQNAIAQDENERHEEAIRGMKEEIAKVESEMMMGGVQKTEREVEPGRAGAAGSAAEASAANAAKKEPTPEEVVANSKAQGKPDFGSSVVVMPGAPVVEKPVEKSNKVETKPTNPSIMELANNTDYSVATIAKEANRIKEREEGEVFISLH